MSTEVTIALDAKLDRLLGLVRVVADDQVSIRAELAVIKADLAVVSTRLDAWLADVAASKIPRLTPVPARRDEAGI